MTLAVLSVREYGPIKCGDTFEPQNQKITKDQHQKLGRFTEAHKRLHKETVFKCDWKQTLIAQNFVGVINLGRDQVEVLPKIDGLGEDKAGQAQVRQNLAAMIASTFDLTLRDGDASQMNSPSDSILEILIRLFCKQLWIEVHKGMLRSYVHRSETLNVLRGRLSVERQIRENSIRPDLLACDFDEFSENNWLNQTLKAALRVLLRVTRSASNHRSVSELLFCFGEVDDVSPAPLRAAQSTSNRISARYDKLLNLAHLFLQKQAPDVITGDGDGFALLFDMNELFEEYIGRVVKKHCSTSELQVRLQGPPLHLARKKAFKLLPDIVGCQGDRIAWIIDTKWKRLDSSQNREGVSPGDMYQMYAYARRYEAPHVILLYPHHGALDARDGDARAAQCRHIFQLKATPPDASVQDVRVCTVNLTNLSTVPMQLKEMIEELAA